MTQEHPITPPPELMQQWIQGWYDDEAKNVGVVPHVATQAARWGADQELEACCEWVHETFKEGFAWCSELRATRRPKPPSLKQQAIEALQRAEEGWRPIPEDCDIIRRALEALPE